MSGDEWLVMGEEAAVQSFMTKYYCSTRSNKKRHFCSATFDLMKQATYYWINAVIQYEQLDGVALVVIGAG